MNREKRGSGGTGEKAAMLPFAAAADEMNEAYHLGALLCPKVGIEHFSSERNMKRPKITTRNNMRDEES